MTHVEEIHFAIRRIYEAALFPENWPSALASVTEAIGGYKALLTEKTPGAAGRSFSSGFEVENASRLQREFETRLPDWIRAIPVGAPMRQSSMISDAAFRRSEIYNETIRPFYGGFYGIVAPLAQHPGRRAYFSVCRHLGAPDFSDDDLEAAKLIVPHLKTALEVQGRLEAADLRTQGVLDVITQLNVGVILFDAALRPVFVNPCAEAIAARRDGLLLSRQAVAATLHLDTEGLRRVMKAALAWHDVSRDGSVVATRTGAPERCYLSRRPPRPPLVVLVVPLCTTGLTSAWNSDARAVLFVMEPDSASGLEQMVLIETFQLTRREAALASLLARGIDLPDTAARLGIGIGTARGYLKQVLAKTGTHRQAELVALLLRSACMAGGVTTAPNSTVPCSHRSDSRGQ
ncbi:DNA-binding CsgD family transcriptional regulator [Paraburkholderia sp. CI2]|uniref:helix-turn-helix transcriptional regulator n=1 Tax=Paraburkholderia sp. CI2 TaxID=2723093 RepID=UPI0016229E14|nr:helix-turn-helix transcriptional regulator [Paraburkholderia sp. CI2]MBB5464231.1 DNA-binding CsgD family transcriptional regulator [Paraburkholderia sp. CI2]